MEGQPLSPLLDDAPRGGAATTHADLELHSEFVELSHVLESATGRGAVRPGATPATVASGGASLSAGRLPLRGARGISRGCYLGYCLLCLLLTGALLVAAVWQALAPRREAHFWRRKLRPWEEAVEAFVGAALCTETIAMLRATGVKRFFRDRWRIFDAAIAGLTVLCLTFFVLRRALHSAGDVVESIDMPILALRFALQPVRMVSTASMVVRAHRLRRQTSPEPPPAPLPPLDPRRPCEALSRSILSLELAAELRELLPCYLRYVDWELAYAPGVHGTSMNTFYRQQGGPNLVVVRDVEGNVFGGFAASEWRPTAGAYGGTEAFVFSARCGGESTDRGDCADPDAAAEAADGGGGGAEAAEDEEEEAAGDEAPSGSNALLAPLGGCGAGEEAAAALRPLDGAPREVALQVVREAPSEPPAERLDVFWAVPREGPSIVQWSDAKMLGLGSALVVFDDFLRGSSRRCDTYCSPPLSRAGKDFIIRDFECWRIGPADD